MRCEEPKCVELMSLRMVATPSCCSAETDVRASVNLPKYGNDCGYVTISYGIDFCLAYKGHDIPLAILRRNIFGPIFRSPHKVNGLKWFETRINNNLLWPLDTGVMRFRATRKIEMSKARCCQRSALNEIRCSFVANASQNWITFQRRQVKTIKCEFH